MSVAAVTLALRRAQARDYEAVLALVDAAFGVAPKASLRQTFPTALGRSNLSGLFVGEHEGQLVCAGAALVRDWVTSAGVLRTACLGCFATAPAHRGRGHSSRLQEWMLQQMKDDGADWAVLFTDRPWIYRGRGFAPAGHERLGWLEPAVWPALPAGAHLRQAEAADAAAILHLYAEHPYRAARSEGDLAVHLDPAVSRVLVLEEAGTVAAYVAIGKGVDFPATVHEYGGSPSHVHALWGWAVRAEGARAVLLPQGTERYLTGPAAGMPGRPQSAAQARVLRPQRVRGGLDRLQWAAWGFDSA